MSSKALAVCTGDSATDFSEFQRRTPRDLAEETIKDLNHAALGYLEEVLNNLAYDQSSRLFLAKTLVQIEGDRLFVIDHQTCELPGVDTIFVKLSSGLAISIPMHHR